MNSDSDVLPLCRKVCLPLSKDELALHLYGDWKGTTVPGKGQNGAGMRILPGQHHLRFMSNWALRQSLGSSAESSLRVDLHDAEFPATGGNARGKGGGMGVARRIRASPTRSVTYGRRDTLYTPTRRRDSAGMGGPPRAPHTTLAL